MSILNIFNSKNKAEKSTELNSNINTERINNKDGILEFKEVIKRVANEQKEIRKTTRSSHNKTDCIVLAQFQNNERENSKWLFQANTAYYIVKHYLWLDENKDKKVEYLNKVVEEAKRVFKTDRTDKDKWLVEKFLDGVDNFVKAYIPNEQSESRLYVLVSKDLDPVYGCVQGGHAVAQWLLEHDTGWKNNYLIYLYADVDEWLEKLNRSKIDYSIFREPDLANKITAIAVENDGELFKKLQLVK